MNSKINDDRVEKRKLSFLTVYYYWLDKEAYLKSKNYISILRTYDELSENEYFFKIGYKTFLIDLIKSKDEIYSAFDHKRQINKAIKSGMLIKQAVSYEEKLNFFNFYQKFAEDPKRKDQILVLQKNELEKLAIFYAVSAEREYLGGIGLLSSFDNRYLLYKYGATVHRCNESEYLMWNAIQYAKDNGYSFFDTSWFQPTEDKNSVLYRLYQFKKKFGGDCVDFYTYVNLGQPFIIPGLLFKFILKYFFKGNLHNLTLFLKKLHFFK